MNQRVLTCPHCKNSDRSMIDIVELHRVYFCGVCAKIFEVPNDSERKGQDSIEDSEKKI